MPRIGHLNPPSLFTSRKADAVYVSCASSPEFAPKVLFFLLGSLGSCKNSLPQFVLLLTRYTNICAAGHCIIITFRSKYIQKACKGQYFAKHYILHWTLLLWIGSHIVEAIAVCLNTLLTLLLWTSYSQWFGVWVPFVCKNDPCQGTGSIGILVVSPMLPVGCASPIPSQ